MGDAEIGFVLHNSLFLIDSAFAKASADRDQTTDNRGQTTEDRRQRTDDRGRTTEGRGQRTDDRGRTTEGRGQRTDDRGRKTDDGRQMTDDRDKVKIVFCFFIAFRNNISCLK